MFTNSMQGISVLSYSLFNSITDIIKSNTTDEVVSDRTQFVSPDGDIYFPMNTALDFDAPSDRKMPSFMIDGDRTVLNLMSYSDFTSNYISNDITTIAFNKTVFLPTLLKRLAEDEKTYGVIIQHGDYMINPLHPAIAFSITSGLMEFPEEGNLHIFEWSESAQRKYSRQSSRSKKKEKEFFEKEYKDLFATFQYLIKKPVLEKRRATINDDDITKLIDSPLIEDINTKISIRIDSDSGSNTTGIKSVLIPTQLAIGNMATPYYGFIHLTNPNSSEVRGYNMSPMLSGNVNQSTCDADTFADLANHTGSGNVCAGSENSNNPRGWFTMSKININSMFGDCIVAGNDMMSYVETSKDISGAIWHGIEQDKLAAIVAAETPEAEPEAEAETVE